MAMFVCCALISHKIHDRLTHHLRMTLGAFMAVVNLASSYASQFKTLKTRQLKSIGRYLVKVQYQLFEIEKGDVFKNCPKSLFNNSSCHFIADIKFRWIPRCFFHSLEQYKFFFNLNKPKCLFLKKIIDGSFLFCVIFQSLY